MNINANFDILYLLKSSDVKYDGLNVNEINTLLYISKLMSVYDGKNAADWGYEFSTNAYGGPFSADIMTELSYLENNSLIQRKEGCFSYNDDRVLDLVEFDTFNYRVRYIDVAINVLLLNPLPTLCLAVQNEVNVMDNVKLRKREVLNVTKDDATYELFEMIRNIYSSKKSQLILPAMAWIKVLISE